MTIPSILRRGFGLIAADRIPKPAFNVFAMLHKLGDHQLKTRSDSALVTKRDDGTMVLALWNYAPPVGKTASYTPGEATGSPKHRRRNRDRRTPPANSGRGPSG